MIRVAIVDDHPVFRDGLRAVLATLPDIVLMDLHLPGMDGIEATRRLLAAHPAIRVLVLTMLEDDLSLLTAIRAGAHGYLVKGAALEG